MASAKTQGTWEELLGRVESATEEVVDAWTDQWSLRVREVGRVVDVGPGVAHVRGLPGVRQEELVRFEGGGLGIAHDLARDTVGIVLLDPATELRAGSEVERTERVLDVPVGEALLGRIVDPTGRARDDAGDLESDRRLPIEREAPAILDRAPVEVPLQTGIKAIDALIPIGRGQRELILGDRQTGKTQIAVDTILHQEADDVICVYCAIGQRSSGVAKTVAQLREGGALDRTVVVVANEDDPAGLRFIAPFAATSIAESFGDEGRDVLLVFDDLTRHARAYRELSLLLRRPPGREAYPGDIFYLHSRLLERATHHVGENGGGSLTALPVIETQAQNISSYIPTNLISITDGQVYLSPSLFRQGQLPAIDVNRSVSRVGGKAQLAAFRAVTGDLKLAYSQFEELERFSRYGTRLDEENRRTLEHGRRVRRILRQGPAEPVPVLEQIVTLYAVSEGLLDDLDPGELEQIEEHLRSETRRRFGERGEDSDLGRRILEGEELEDEDQDRLRSICQEVLEGRGGEGDGDPAGTAQEDR